MIFVKPAVRKSLLAKMLGEILDTRVMVKHAMKGSRSDKVRDSSFATIYTTNKRLVIAPTTERSSAWSQTHGREYSRLIHVWSR